VSRARRRFLVEESQVREGRVVLTGAQFHHARRVLRLKRGDEIGVFTRSGVQYPARVESAHSDSMVLEIISQRGDVRTAGLQLTVVQGVVKGPAMDMIVQKCGELGVARLVAAGMKRCAVRLRPEQQEAKRERWQKIADHAAEQCSAARPMQVSVARDLADALGLCRQMPVIALHQEERESSLGQAIKRAGGATSLALVIGPEGGLDAEEVEMLGRAGAHFASLGPRVLKAETAALAACAIVMYTLGELGEL